MMAVSIGEEGKMSTACYKDFESKNFCQVQFMRKVKGYDIFVLASKGSIAIVELKNKEGSVTASRSSRNSNRSISGDKEFVVLNFMEGLFNSYIYEVAIFNNLMVPVALGGKDDYIKIIKLNV